MYFAFLMYFINLVRHKGLLYICAQAQKFVPFKENVELFAAFAYDVVDP
jgi:hypothetical protein